MLERQTDDCSGRAEACSVDDGFPGGCERTGWQLLSEVGRRRSGPRVSPPGGRWPRPPRRLCALRLPRGLEALKPHGGHLGLGGRVEILELRFIVPGNGQERGPQLCGPPSGGRGQHAVRGSPDSFVSQVRSDEL